MTMPSRVVFDIETLAYPFEEFDEEQQMYLMKFAKTEEERAEAMEKLSLGALTARVIAIAMLNPDSNRGQVFYDHPGGERRFDDDKMVEFIPADERQILEGFWKSVEHYRQFVTFNGRSFDCPFIMIRSAILGIKATRNLVPYRYQSKEHCDLMDQLTFFGASRKYSLDFYCKAFGIKSPKSNGITGLDLRQLYSESRFDEIATYCLGDVKATAELFRRWQGTIAFES